MERISFSNDSSKDDDARSFEFTFHKYLDSSARIEVDSNAADSDMQDGVSLTESIFNYHKENGRTYHAFRAGSYYFPNDQLELERMNNQYELLKIFLDGRNYLTPWSRRHPPRKVLDIATGDGRWAIEMGDEFPTAEIVGIDLSPVQPNIVPPNVNFFVEDATDEWHEEGVDFIHTRISMGCWGDIYSEMIAKAYERLVPGGWLEMQEVDGMIRSDDGSMPPNSPFYLWCKSIIQASREAHRVVDPVSQLKIWFHHAGFVDVHEKIIKLPMNGWPRNPRLKRMGEMWQTNMQNGLQAFSYGLMYRVMHKTKEEIEVSLIDVRKDICDTKQHRYHNFHVVWGRKPLPGEKH